MGDASTPTPRSAKKGTLAGSSAGDIRGHGGAVYLLVALATVPSAQQTGHVHQQADKGVVLSVDHQLLMVLHEAVRCSRLCLVTCQLRTRSPLKQHMACQMHAVVGQSVPVWLTAVVLAHGLPGACCRHCRLEGVGGFPFRELPERIAGPQLCLLRLWTDTHNSLSRNNCAGNGTPMGEGPELPSLGRMDSAGHRTVLQSHTGNYMAPVWWCVDFGTTA
jgi:hypothetical protein